MPQADKDLIGKIEFYNDTLVKGWALNKSLPDEPIAVTVLDSEKKLGELTPSVFRIQSRPEGCREQRSVENTLFYKKTSSRKIDEFYKV